MNTSRYSDALLPSGNSHIRSVPAFRTSSRSVHAIHPTVRSMQKVKS
jgi:hypothetical protein